MVDILIKCPKCGTNNPEGKISSRFIECSFCKYKIDKSGYWKLTDNKFLVTTPEPKEKLTNKDKELYGSLVG